MPVSPAFLRTLADVVGSAHCLVGADRGPFVVDPCHLAHGQPVRRQPRALLRAIPGLEMVDLRESEMCCGSAGIYNLTEPGMARQLLQRKVGHLQARGAEAVVTANPGCILQIAAGLRERGVPMRVLHIVELLDTAYVAAEGPGLRA